MICTKNLVRSFKEVPPEWIWMNYCNLWDVPFDGGRYKIHSLFKREKTPSMNIYYGKNERYRFKDFSTGLEGNEVELVKRIYEYNHGRILDFSQVADIVVCDYNNWIISSKGSCELQISDFKKQKKYQVKFKTRGWTELDKKQWTPFYIGSNTLNTYNVGALDEFTLFDEENEFTVVGDNIYGYFNVKGELCKIYQPKTSKMKFVFIREYLQGEDQLKSRRFLLIQSGLKDIMSFHSMNLEIDQVAPDSENTMIVSSKMKRFFKEYEQVLIMLDNDEAGYKSMMKYQKMYPQIKPVLHSLEGRKDTAEIIHSLGPKKGRNYFIPLIDKTLCNNPLELGVHKSQMKLF